MSHYSFNGNSMRLAKTKMATQLGGTIKRLFQVGAGIFFLIALPMIFLRYHIGFSLAGLGVMLLVLLTWIHRDLESLKTAVVGSTTELSELLPANVGSKYQPAMSAGQFWAMLSTTAGANFIMLRFGLTPDRITAAIGNWQLDHDALWTETERVTTNLGLQYVTDGTVMAALFRVCPGLQNLLTTLKLSSDDIDEGAHWLARLDAYLAAKRPVYGGIARDWAAGFTPLLSRYGTNLSQQAEFTGKYLPTQERTNQLDSLMTALDSANGSVVLVGEPGIGKSALLLGLSDYILQGKNAGSLAHHQVISLNASLILANAQSEGGVENVMLQLLNEAIHATNIVIALDEAQLFFGQGTGAVNLSQVLLPVLQTRRIKLVLAITPGDWQKLKATNAGMASLLTPLVLAEPSQKDVMRTLADRSVLLERGKVFTTYQGLLEAYRLSGRYLQEESYPGKALKVLEAALNFPDGQFISEKSVQQAIESQFGVKVQTASTTESDVLLHLEDKIHERMINQTRAVSVVANALRRARAGVANPRRPIGSFLFLGPTGVGKTELARSLAALYFGSEQNIIRLDMSEYQQIADVDRILQSAAENSEALLAKVRQAPFSVVLFDEIEKAHPNVLNLFLQLLDEGNLTDTAGKPTSFKDAIVIATSNAGADKIRAHIEAGEQLEQFEEGFVNELINSGTFKPELLNRFDEIVLFRPLNQSELGLVVRNMIAEVNKTLDNQKISVELADDAVAELVKAGYDPRLGARPMRRMVQRRVEDAVAGMILRGEAQPGAVIHLDAAHLASAGATEPTETPAEPPTPPAAPTTPPQNT